MRRYSNFILKVVWEFETDPDEAMEKYLYVCSHLAANDRAILRKFQQAYGPGKAPRFTSWLYAVVRNLCIDAYRAAQGRRRYPRAVARLSDYDRRVFELYYWEGYAVDQIEHLTAGRHPGETVAEALARIEAVLTRRAKERAVQAHRRPVVSYEDGMPTAETNGPEDSIFSPASRIEHWLAELSEEEQLIVRLRFWEDLSGPEIARVLGIEPSHRVYRALRKALDHLRGYAIKERGP